MADNNKPVSKVIQNIDDIIKKWALKGKDNQDKYTVEIVKNGLEFIQVGEINYMAVKKMEKPEDLVPIVDEQPKPSNRTSTVHTTSFVNATSAAEQKHHFRVERTNKTSYSWAMNSGHTFSSRAGISLSPPHTCIEASVEFGKTTEESTNEVNSTEKTRTNVIECDVIVPRGKRVNVNLIITEVDFIARYDVEYRIHGDVTVVVKKGDRIDFDRRGEAQDIFRGMDGFKVTPKTQNHDGFAKFVNKGIFISKRETRQELELRDEDL